MSGDRVILITGSTDGLGRRVAEKLAAPGVHLLVHGRDATRGQAVVDAVARAGGSARFFAADFSALSEVRRLAAAVAAEHAQLDLLINNAGIAKPGTQPRESADGFELHFAVNFLAPFLLTRLLRPRLGATAVSRIVNVASAGQAPIDFSDVMLERGYDGMRAYCQSKLAQVMDTFDLAEELTGTNVTVNCLHPATFMDTAMVRDSGASPLNTVETGADAVLALVARKGITGRYYDVQREARANAQAYDIEARRKLRAISMTLTGFAA
ncbi:SDR family NAD(P)-dependent oxidoreductase [Dongia sedimenti]|uniref:SDR family NAD(P)-dependent oxidoreductase n=1 Tax=Dongia sedimenti TaxID=3064282 RepID=A0ABU0YQB7_9PROT|nr:SDR family NAD(P)-dependent oxidoreductase [Rhodospirillaceae bacterium R-7]